MVQRVQHMYKITLLVYLYTISSHKANTCCSTHIMIIGYIRILLPMHHTFMINSMELINYQCISEWICVVVLFVNLTNFYHIIGYILSYKKISKYNSSVIQ